MKHYFREISVVLALGSLLLVLAVFAPSFYQAQPLLSLAAREAPALVVTCGMAVVLICRQIDISVGSQFSVCSVAPACWLPCTGRWGCVAGIGCWRAFGALNGALVAGLGLPSIVVTLATMVTWREGLRWLRQGVWVDLPEGLNGLASVRPPANGRWSAWRSCSSRCWRWP